MITVPNIQKTVAEYFKIRIADLLSKRRTRSIARPRQLAMALAKTNGAGCTVTVRNYRKDGSTFWNQVFVCPLRDHEGATTNFVGVQCEITPELARASIAGRRM